MNSSEDRREDERGRRPRIDRDGGVHGSGSGAGGNNPGEDFDDDVMAGSGVDPVGGPRKVDRAAEQRTDTNKGR